MSAFFGIVKDSANGYGLSSSRGDCTRLRRPVARGNGFERVE